MNETKSQEEQILQALLAGRKLTPIDALNEFSCFRLGARIWSLKKRGFDIHTEDFKTPTGKHVALYSIPAQPSLIR
jgi:hypothetical protein